MLFLRHTLPATSRLNSLFPMRFDHSVIVERTFEELAVAEPGYISFEEYSRLASSHPMMLQQASIRTPPALFHPILKTSFVIMQMTLDMTAVMRNTPKARKYLDHHPERSEEGSASVVASAARASKSR